jgi:hypothetical protein
MNFIFINSSCWLSGYSAIFAILVPIFLILLSNSILFGLIMRKHCACFSKRQLEIATVNKSTNSKRPNILLSTSFVNMGLTWLTGFLLIFQMNEYVKTTLALFFCLFNAFQGFLIFSVYIVLSKARRDYIKQVAVDRLRRLKKSLGFFNSKYSIYPIGASSKQQHQQSRIRHDMSKMRSKSPIAMQHSKSSESSNQTQEIRITTSSSSNGTKSK